MKPEGLLKVHCIWVNDNAFYWCVEEFVRTTTYKLFFKNDVKDIHVNTHRLANIDKVFEIAEQLSWNYSKFTMILDKSNL